MSAESASAARRRLSRFLFDDPDRTDQIITLSKRQQNELVDLAYSGDTRGARAKLAEYTSARSKQRSASSKKAAYTRAEYRRAKAVDTLLRMLRNTNKKYRETTVRRHSYLWTSRHYKAIESKPESVLSSWVTTEARKKMRPGETNPMWYQ